MPRYPSFFTTPNIGGGLPVSIQSKWVRSVLSAASVILFVSAFVWGQTFVNGSIVGTVTDKTGASIPNATITLTNLGTNVKRVVQTNPAGLYRFMDVLPGSYRLEAQKAGFRPYSREPIVVEVASGIRANIGMSVGAVTQEVTVTAPTPLLQPQTSSLGQVITSRSVNELPLNGRNPLALVDLVPGVIPQQGSGGTPVGQNPFYSGNFQIGGGVANQSATYLDGAPLNTSYINNLAIVPVQDAVQEFKVQTNNLSAQYGRFAGGIVNFTTKSGTNTLHGSAYEFLRNKVLNANNFFNNEVGLDVPAFTQNQFGFTLGGPVVIPRLYSGKNKTFFFVSYEGFRLRQGEALLLTVPTLAERQGDFSNLRSSNGSLIPIYDPLTTCGQLNNAPCAVDASGNPIIDRQQFSGNVIPSGDIDPAAKILTNLWAPPNLPGAPITNINNWAGNVSRGGNSNQLTARVDQNIGQKQRIFVRYTLDRHNSLTLDPFGTGAMVSAVPGGGQPEVFVNQQGVFDDSFSFSPTTIVDVNFSILRQTYQRVAVSTGFDLGTLGPGWAPLNNQVTARTLPTLVVNGGIASFTNNTGSEISDFAMNYYLAPTVTTVKGSHTIQFGGNLEIQPFNYLQLAGAGGHFNFNQGFTALDPFTSSGGYGFASFLLGDSTGGNLPVTLFVAAQQISRALFVEDTYHATRRLTLNLGLRYENLGPWSERFNRLSYFNPSATSPLAQATGLPLMGDFGLVASATRSSRNNINPDNLQFAPRIGFAYQLTPNTVLRSGYGIFWLPNDVSFGANSPNNDVINHFNNPFVGTINGGLTPFDTLSDPFPGGLIQPPQRNPNFDSTLLGQGVNTVLSNNPYAYAQQWNFDVQRMLPGSTLLDVAYAGSKGTHLPIGGLALDQLSPQYMAMGSALSNSVANPFFGLISSGSLSANTVTAGQLLRPYPQYTGIGWQGANIANSSYNSLQITLRKPFARGQTLLVAYTASKLITNASSTLTGWLESGGVSGIQNNYDLAAERSLSDFDASRRLVVSYVMDLPFGRGRKYLRSASGVPGKLVSGWGVDGVTTFQTGFPLHLTTSKNLTNSYGGGSRPNFDASACTGSAALSGSPESRLSKWFNTACFAQPAPFTFGNVGPTLPNVRADGISNFDFAIFKDTAFGPEDKLNLQFRAEVFDLFNHPQFGHPGQSYGTAQFGVVSSQVNDPRLVQFALRFRF